jgi:hypothetical protein
MRRSIDMQRVHIKEVVKKGQLDKESAKKKEGEYEESIDTESTMEIRRCRRRIIVILRVQRKEMVYETRREYTEKMVSSPVGDSRQCVTRK